LFWQAFERLITRYFSSGEYCTCESGQNKDADVFYCVVLALRLLEFAQIVLRKSCVYSVLIVNWTKFEPGEICVHGDFCLNKTPAAVTIYDYNRSFVK